MRSDKAIRANTVEFPPNVGLRKSNRPMVFTDPPYNVRIDGHATGLGTIQHKDFKMASGEMSPAEFTDFLSRVCSLLATHSADGSIHFVCMDWRHMGELLAAGRQAYSELKNVCVWAKDNAGTSGVPQPDRAACIRQVLSGRRSPRFRASGNTTAVPKVAQPDRSLAYLLLSGS
jgi:hypothetical protein